jgi:hypothetical protein
LHAGASREVTARKTHGEDRRGGQEVDRPPLLVAGERGACAALTCPMTYPKKRDD